MFQSFPVEVLSGKGTAPGSAQTQNDNLLNQIDGSGKSILVIDDEFLIRHMLTDIFTTVNFQVVTAGDGADGLDKFAQQPEGFNLVVLDMVMPVMGGEQAFYRIREINPNQKILICSGYNNLEDVQAMIQSGAVGLLPKPFNLKELFSVVKDALTD